MERMEMASLNFGEWIGDGDVLLALVFLIVLLFLIVCCVTFYYFFFPDGVPDHLKED